MVRKLGCIIGGFPSLANREYTIHWESGKTSDFKLSKTILRWFPAFKRHPSSNQSEKMRVLLQRVSKASVKISGAEKSHISEGILILLGIEKADTAEDIEWLVRKILSLRIFEDSDGKMNLSVLDIDGELLVVSQFTLHARVKKGTRPSFERAAPPDQAIPLYEKFVTFMENALGKPVATGQFGAMMDVALVNDGPVTIWIDSQNRE